MLKYRYNVPFPFTGKIDKLTFTLIPPVLTSETEKPVTEEDGKHLITFMPTQWCGELSVNHVKRHPVIIDNLMKEISSAAELNFSMQLKNLKKGR